MSNPAIPVLVDEVTRAIGVIPSATALINGFGARMQAAVEQALELGATAEQLAPLTALGQELDATTSALAQAVQVNS